MAIDEVEDFCLIGITEPLAQGVELQVGIQGVGFQPGCKLAVTPGLPVLQGLARLDELFALRGERIVSRRGIAAGQGQA